MFSPVTGSNDGDLGIRESDLVKIDLDQQRLFHELVVTLIRVDSAFCRKLDSIDLSVIGGVVESWRAAKDIHLVVMTP